MTTDPLGSPGSTAADAVAGAPDDAVAGPVSGPADSPAGATDDPADVVPADGSAGGALDAAMADDPAVGLRAVRSLRVLADRLETLQVGRARELGWSWQDVADALGVSRQAVHQKHHRRTR